MGDDRAAAEIEPGRLYVLSRWFIGSSDGARPSFSTTTVQRWRSGCKTVARGS